MFSQREICSNLISHMFIWNSNGYVAHLVVVVFPTGVTAQRITPVESVSHFWNVETKLASPVMSGLIVNDPLTQAPYYYYIVRLVSFGNPAIISTLSVT